MIFSGPSSNKLPGIQPQALPSGMSSGIEYAKRTLHSHTVSLSAAGLLRLILLAFWPLLFSPLAPTISTIHTCVNVECPSNFKSFINRTPLALVLEDSTKRCLSLPNLFVGSPAYLRKLCGESCRSATQWVVEVHGDLKGADVGQNIQARTTNHQEGCFQ